jgi:hypothetical protein
VLCRHCWFLLPFGMWSGAWPGSLKTNIRFFLTFFNKEFYLC